MSVGGGEQEDPFVKFPEFLTAEQVSDILGVSVATLNRWAALRESTGEEVGPPYYTISDRVRRWAADDVRKWLVQNRH